MASIHGVSDASSPGKAKARSAATALVDPIARLLLAARISPNAVTVVGALGAMVTAVVCFPSGRLVLGAIGVGIFALLDLLDGSMARMAQRESVWGAFLDSVLDRVVDAAVFGALAVWFFRGGDDTVLGCVALYCLIAGGVISYARARAEGLGLDARGGIAERTERLLIAMIATGLSGLGVAYIQAVGLWVLAGLTTVTVVQRMIKVYRQASAAQNSNLSSPA